MIRPSMVPISERVLPGLQQLFMDCGVPYASTWTFNPKRSLVAMWKGEVVGFVTSWWDKQPIAWVDMLLVTPKYKGHGIGAWLGWTIEAVLRRDGAQAIRCILDEGEEFAVPLEKAGFSRVGTFLVMERHYEA